MKNSKCKVIGIIIGITAFMLAGDLMSTVSRDARVPLPTPWCFSIGNLERGL